VVRFSEKEAEGLLARFGMVEPKGAKVAPDKAPAPRADKGPKERAPRAKHPTESQHQRAFVLWRNYWWDHYPVLRLLYAVPNGGYRTDKTAAIMKLEGQLPGVPDLCLPAARRGYHGLYIEMKRPKEGRLSDHQREFIAALEAEGYLVRVCRGFEEAKRAVVEYLELPLQTLDYPLLKV
jgi:hypothetical protein